MSSKRALKFDGALPTSQIQELVAGAWNAAQDKVGKSIKAGEHIDPLDLLMLIVTQEALASRDEYGRRYFDIAIQRAG